MRRVLLCFLSLLAFVAEADVYSFRQLDIARSLYGNCVNVMLEDDHGYLWLGTSKGLYRFDGYELRNQCEVTPDLVSRNELVTNLQEDASHHLWISRSAASEYLVIGPNHEAMTANDYLQRLGMASDQQFLMHIDPHGDLWRVSKDSVYYYNFDRAEVHRFATEGLSTASNQRISVKAYKSKLYIVEGKLLHIFNTQDQSWQHETLDINFPWLGDDVQGVMLANNYIDRRGGLWIYSLFSEDILYRNPETEEWKHITLPHDGLVMQNSIRRVVEDSDNGIWIATDHRGLFLYSPASDSFQQYVHVTGDDSSIASNNIMSLMFDTHHTLWLGYFKTGISYCRPQLDLVKHHSGPYGDITSLLADADGNRWIGTDGQGLWRETPDGKAVQISQMPNLTVTDLQQDSDGRIWVGTYDHGLYCVLPNTGQTQHYSAASGQLPHDGAGRIVFDGYDRLWVCSAFGPFYCFNPKTGVSQIYKGDTGADLMGEAVCYDAQGNQIIMATYYGLWVQNLQNDQGYYMLNASQGRQSLHEFRESNLLADDNAPLIWMSHDQGITIWDMQADTLYLVSQDQGLTAMVQALRQDAQHNVWASTVSGLSMIQPLKQADGTWTFQVRNLVSSDNALESYFNPYAGARTREGIMLFGGPDGYSEFDSRSILTVAAERMEPCVSIIQLKDKVITPEQLLELEYDDLPLTFHFYTGNPLDAREVTYSYRVKGLNEEWMDTRLNTLSLLSLPPGSYELELKAIGLCAEWSDVFTLPIKVSPPWWNATWMRFLYAALLILVGVLLLWRPRKTRN